jgi:hypothetical protein
MLVVLAVASCATPTGHDPAAGTGGAGGAAGAPAGSGGNGTGGAIATGGVVGTGGAIGTGGSVGTGGAVGTGGTIGTGGARATGGAGGGGTSLLTDGFENGTGQWLTSGGGTAAVTIDGNHVYDLSDPTSKIFLAAAGDVSWTDVKVSAKVKILSWAGSSSSDYAGLCARVADADDYTCVILRGDGKAAIRADDGGSSGTLGSTVSASLTPGTWHNVSLQIDARGITASLDGTMVLPKAGDAAATAPSPTGGIALIVANAEAEFDDIIVNP